MGDWDVVKEEPTEKKKGAWDVVMETQAKAFPPGGSGLPEPEQAFSGARNLLWKHSPELAASMVGERMGRPFGIPGRLVGSGLGLAAGRAYRMLGDYARGEMPESGLEAAKDIGWGFAEGAVGEGLGTLPFKAIRGIAAPARGKITEAGRHTMELARKHNLPISASRHAPNWLTNNLQRMSDLFLGGRLVQSQKQSKLTETLLSWRNSLIRERLGLPTELTKYESGAGMSKALSEMKNFDEAYGGFGRILNQMERVDFSNTLNFLLLGKKGKRFSPVDFGWSSGAKSPWNDIKRLWTDPENVQGRHIHWILSHVWDARKFEDITLAQKENRAMLKEALLADIGHYADEFGKSLAQLKQEGDVVAGEIKEWFKTTPLAERIIKIGGKGSDPTQVVNALFKTSKTDELLKIKEALTKYGGRDFWDSSMAGFIEEILGKCTTRSPETGASKFLPAAFAEQVEEFGPMLKKIEPQVYARMKEFADISEAAAAQHIESNLLKVPWWATITAGGFMSKWAGLGPKAGATLFVFVPNGFAALATQGLMGTGRMARLFQKWATKESLGIPARVLSETGRQTTKAGVLLGGEEVRFKKQEP